ncbi:MAG: phosphatase PAP2 family protein, partial [Firmicutes bacterium]|nr:phosphatase PAP2 family protein [Bacillota bacterium]
PSIHCSTSTAIILCHWFSRRLSGKKPIYLVVKILVTIWMCSVIVSTLFVKQHSIIDIYWGVGLSIVLFLVSYVPALLKKRNA